MRCITLLTSATTGTGSAAGLRRRRRFLILAIGSGGGAGCLRGLPSLFLVGIVSARLSENQKHCESVNFHLQIDSVACALDCSVPAVLNASISLKKQRPDQDAVIPKRQVLRDYLIKEPED